MVTAAGLSAYVIVTPIVWVPLSQTCWTALVTSSDVMISASSAYSPSPRRAERGPHLQPGYRH